jgi:hypothetical protein
LKFLFFQKKVWEFLNAKGQGWRPKQLRRENENKIKYKKIKKNNNKKKKVVAKREMK